MIDEADVNAFKGVLKEILDLEIAEGNELQETWRGNWPYNNVLAIVLKKPFITPIQRQHPNIKFNNINDSHYCKAEYYDTVLNQILICNFDGKPDFSDM